MSKISPEVALVIGHLMEALAGEMGAYEDGTLATMSEEMHAISEGLRVLLADGHNVPGDAFELMSRYARIHTEGISD